MELIQGCRNRMALTEVQRYLRRLTVLPVSLVASQTTYELMEAYFLSHGLRLEDALIAAAALEHGRTLDTKNVRHFQMIPSLHVRRPY